MVDYKKQLENIKNYIKKYNDYLTPIEEYTIIDDFIDFDRYKQNFIIFIEIDNINYPITNFNDDCGGIQKMTFNIYLVFRGDTPANLNNKMLNASSSFYELIKHNDIENIMNTNINRVDFFKYIEGSKNIISSKFTIQFDMEI